VEWSGRHQTESGRNREWEDTRLGMHRECGGARPTRKAQGVGRHKADSGRRREWDDTCRLREVHEAGGHGTRPIREDAGSGRTQGRLGKTQGVSGHKADLRRQRKK
jgi:hypothetical protein